MQKVQILILVNCIFCQYSDSCVPYTIFGCGNVLCANFVGQVVRPMTNSLVRIAEYKVISLHA